MLKYPIALALVLIIGITGILVCAFVKFYVALIFFKFFVIGTLLYGLFVLYMLTNGKK